MGLADELVLKPFEIRFFDKRILNPFEAVIAFAARERFISVSELYELLIKYDLPKLADILRER